MSRYRFALFKEVLLDLGEKSHCVLLIALEDLAYCLSSRVLKSSAIHLNVLFIEKIKDALAHPVSGK